MSTGHCINCQVAVVCLLLVQSSRFVSPTPLSLVTKTANAATTVGSTVIGTTDATGHQTLPSAGSSAGSSVSQDRLLQTSPGPRSTVTATTYTALGSITLTSSPGPSIANHRPSSSHPFLATTTGIQAPATATTIVAITTVESRPVTTEDGDDDGGGGVVGGMLIAGQPLPQHRSIVTAMDERLESLDCELPMVPHDSRLWKGNETQELLLPISIPSDCSISEDCPIDEVSTTLSWEGTAEIQSGDVLLVRIDDVHLIEQKSTNATGTHNHSPTRLMHEPTTAVYQVTRTGHDNCDVTEGILLDITPLKIDNRKVVTLYDKDLTEGMNLLIVVSELWGNKKCVRLKVVVKSDNCGENEDCSGKGLCYSNVSMEGYECQCCPGFVGSHCEEKDACYPSPCRNNGICVDLSQGHEGSTFQCLCPYGYTGKTCEEETDPCTSMPCQNGATCTGNVTQFKCACLTGFSGQQCQHNMNVCESSPCVHGICMGQEDSFICYCEPGYTGTHCEYEYNECESSPCINGGTCTDHVAEYSCSCGRGFTGKRCHIKVDLCEPNPCPEPLYCLDRGNNYSCECPKGYTGVDCLTPSRPACSTNPCNNGGTCWSSMDSFYCACRPGFTGKTCEDEFVVETITNMDPINKENELVLKMPISIHLDHLHNLYIAAGTLACAFVFVALIVTVCHCRVNKPYKRFSLRTHPLLLRCKDRDNGDGSPAGGGGGGGGSSSCGRRGVGTEVVTSTNTNSEWFSGKDKALMATPSRSLPSLDTTDMYYTLDFSDSQSSPLIQ